MLAGVCRSRSEIGTFSLREFTVRAATTPAIEVKGVDP